jgi:exopolyphosphatase/guanosine-5'-triphosphate,3'-diphosphate pyrophosphatase
LKLAAIDIGSNAVRLLIEEIFEDGTSFRSQKVSFTRIPLRLGDDVFEFGHISHQKAVQLTKVMRAFWYLMDVHDITAFRCYATSAMREAANNRDIIDLVKREAGIEIQIMTGEDEADAIFGNFSVQRIDHSTNYLYIDVGGGSTELTLIKNGQREKSRSFTIGTVRMLKDQVKNGDWDEAKEWLKAVKKSEEKLIGIATGGNINRLYKMSRRTFGELITTSELREIYEAVAGYSFEERMEKLGLKRDRADVIVNAGQIYLHMLEHAGIEDVMVPRIGLADGIIVRLYNELKNKA